MAKCPHKIIEFELIPDADPPENQYKVSIAE
jgi:hypothetical protein